MTDFSMDILDQLSSPKEVVKNLEENLPKLIVILKNESCNSYFLQIIKTLLKNVLAELEVEEIEKRLLRQVLSCVSEIFSQSISSVCNSIDTNEVNDEIVVTLSQLLQVCLDILSGYNELLEYIIIQKNEIKVEFIASLHKTLPQILLQAFTHCKDSEANYGTYFMECTDILTTFFRKSYEIYLKYFKALEDKLIFNCNFEEDITILTEVLDAIITVIEIVTCLDIKTAAEQWKCYIKVNNKYSEQIKMRLDLVRPLSVLTLNIKQIIKTVTTDGDVLDDKARNRHLKIGSFVLKIFIKLCEYYKGYLDDCLSQILDVLILLYSCSKNTNNEGLINRELDTYICVGGAALLNQFYEDENFIKEMHKLYIRRVEFLDSELGLFFVVLVTMKKTVNSQSKVLQDKWDRYPLIEIILNLHNEVGIQIDMNSQIDGKDIHTNVMSIVMAFMLSTVTADSYYHIEKILFECLFSMNIHTSLLVSDLLCLLARFTSESICLEMVEYLCETLVKWPVHLSVYRPEYIIVRVTLTRLARLLTDKSCAIISAKYCRDYTSNISYLLAKSILRKNNLTIALPSMATLKEDLNIFVNKLKFACLKGSVEDKNESEQSCKLCIASLEFVRKENNISERGASWIQNLACHFLRFLPSLLPCLTNLQTLEILSRLQDATKCSNSSLKIFSARFLRKIAEHKFELDSDAKEVFNKIADNFIDLLKDNDHLIQQEALESYSYFAQLTTHEEIVFLVLNHSNDLQELIKLFLQKKIIVKAKESHFVLSNKQRYDHKCEKRIQMLDESECRPTKKLKHSTDEVLFQNSLSTISKEIKQVREYIKCQTLPEQCKIMIRDISKDFDEIKMIISDDVIIEELDEY